MKPFDLVALDVDGTLVQTPDGRIVWEILNERFTGSDDQNKKRYARYRAGKLSYAEWVALDISDWRNAGARREDIVAALAPLRVVSGAREALAALKDAGYRLVAISGTLDVMLETVFPDHPFEEVHCNHIGFDRDGNISHWRATPFDMAGKSKALRAIALREGLRLERCCFVGDSSNDVWIAREAGLGIAFNPKCAELEEAADVVVNTPDLRAILPHLLPRG